MAERIKHERELCAAAEKLVAQRIEHERAMREQSEKYIDKALQLKALEAARSSDKIIIIVLGVVSIIATLIAAYPLFKK